MTRILTFLFSVIVTVSLTAPAVAQSDGIHFYRTELPVRSQEAKERQFAAQRGMQEVLVRMSGSRTVLDNPQVQEAIGTAQSYVEQFEYRRLEDDDLLGRGYTDKLVLVFSPRVIMSLLREAGQPFWAETRPRTLVWLVEDTAEGRRFVGPADNHPLVGELADVALTRGLPLQYPMLDLDDQIALSPDRAWALDEQAIRQASERYGAEVILMGRFSTTSAGSTIATWQAMHRGQSRVYDSRTEDLESLARQALAPLAEWLSGMYAIVPSTNNEQRLYMQVAGVTSFASYIGTLSYLDGLVMATDVQLVAVREDTLLVAMAADTDLEKFTSALRLDSQLTPVEDAAAATLVSRWQQSLTGTRESPLRYRWSGR